MVSVGMCMIKKRSPRINYVGVIICLFVAFLTFSGCSKSGKDDASPPDISVINDSLKDYRFIRQHFEDPDRVKSFLARLVVLYCNGWYHEVASSATLRTMERSGLQAWLRAREKSEIVLRGLCSDPKVVLEGNKWKVVFNVLKRDGSVEMWQVVGKNEPEHEYNQIHKIEITTLKPAGTFSWPMMG